MLMSTWPASVKHLQALTKLVLSSSKFVSVEFDHPSVSRLVVCKSTKMTSLTCTGNKLEEVYVGHCKLFTTLKLCPVTHANFKRPYGEKGLQLSCTSNACPKFHEKKDVMSITEADNIEKQKGKVGIVECEAW